LTGVPDILPDRVSNLSAFRVIPCFVCQGEVSSEVWSVVKRAPGRQGFQVFLDFFKRQMGEDKGETNGDVREILIYSVHSMLPES
jgi:hypothetical protein